MIAIPSNIVDSGLLLLITLATGVWLSRTAKPISTALLTVHKLIALGTVISAGFAIYRSRAGFAGWREPAAALAAALVVSLFASGALLCGEKNGRAPVLNLHRIAALLVTALAAATAYILSSAAL